MIQYTYKNVRHVDVEELNRFTVVNCGIQVMDGGMFKVRVAVVSHIVSHRTRAVVQAATARRIAEAAIRRDDYARSHSLEGRGEGARRRAPPDDIDFVPSPARAAPRPLSASDLECSPLAPTDTSDRMYALTT